MSAEQHGCVTTLHGAHGGNYAFLRHINVEESFEESGSVLLELRCACYVGVGVGNAFTEHFSLCFHAESISRNAGIAHLKVHDFLTCHLLEGIGERDYLADSGISDILYAQG